MLTAMFADGTDLDSVATALPAYEVDGELGRGAWGVVIGARHRRLGRRVAIKQLPSSFAADPDVRARFVSEAQLLAGLDHPHIVPVYDYVETDGLCLLVMEQLGGGTVWDRMTGAGVDIIEACAIALAVSVALEYAHRGGVLHRDVKPENVLITSDRRQLKIGDFGTAKVLGGATTMVTAAGDVVGTPAYMAPEQAVGGPVTAATDVYALATMLYELIAGVLPFPRGETPLALLYQRVNEPPVELRDAAPNAPDRLAAVVMSALSVDPAGRPSSAEDFAVALAEGATGAFGRGWLERSGLRVSLGPRIAAIAERAPRADRAATSARATVRRTRVAQRDETFVAPIDPAALVPVEALPIPAESGTSLRDLRVLLTRTPHAAARQLAREIERAELNTPELLELDLLRSLRAAEHSFTADERLEVERLLGLHGRSPAERVGLQSSATADDIGAAALDAIERWKRVAEHPMSSRTTAAIASEVVRAAERVAADIAGATGSPPLT